MLFKIEISGDGDSVVKMDLDDSELKVIQRLIKAIDEEVLPHGGWDPRMKIEPVR